MRYYTSESYYICRSITWVPISGLLRPANTTYYVIGVMFKPQHIEKTTKMKMFWAWLILFMPLCANALGIKDIAVSSALNQPLDARIELVSVSGINIHDIKVRLASPKVFEEAGIGRPYFLTLMKFEPMLSADGNAYIHITSRDTVREPYLDFMLEVNWRGGSLTKEFAVLLDPAILRGTSSEPKNGVATPAANNSASAKGEVYGPVQEAETLWIIAQKTRPDPSISIRQMIMAIYQENPGAFAHGNINLLKRGVTLKIPDQRSIMAITYGTASKLYSEQEQEWKAGQATADEPATTNDLPAPTNRETPIAPLTTPDTETAASKTDQTKQDAKDPQHQTKSDTGNLEAPQEKLEVVATAAKQLDEVTPSQGIRAYPQDEIEQLRGSIADSTEDTSALESINRDLVRLRSALKSKIALIKKELEKTDRAIAIVSEKLQTADTATTEETASSADDATANQQNIDPEIIKPIVEAPTATTSKLIDTSAPEQAPGINITTDQVDSEQINRLETEIAALKAQGSTLRTQRYLIVILALACMAAFGFILFSNRKKLPAINSQKLNRILDQLKLFIRSLNIDNKVPAPMSDTSSTIEAAQPQQHTEIPFDAPDTGRKQEVSFTEPPATLSNHDADQHAAESNNRPKQNTVMFENPRQEDEHDLDYTLTSVDVYLAYRRFSEAESIVRDAIEQHPNQPELKAKLLEIYSFKKDAKLFTQHLESYREELSTQAPNLWEEALQAGMQLIPKHPFIQAYSRELQGTANPSRYTEPGRDGGNID
ncbi:MAG: FimV/HubP family polar landmark protein, partial [Gammaproteobacteria bacterium]